jgi:hypothetical protein
MHNHAVIMHMYVIQRSSVMPTAPAAAVICVLPVVAGVPVQVVACRDQVVSIQCACNAAGLWF